MSTLLTSDVSNPLGLESAFGNVAISRVSLPKPQYATFSNRCSFCTDNAFPISTIQMSPRIGIDKIAVEIPLAVGIGEPHLFLSSIKNTIMGRWATKATTKHLVTGSTIYWQFIKSRWSIRLELNPSRFVDPDGFSLASPKSCVRVIQEVIKEFMLDGDEALPLFVINAENEIDLDHWREDWTDLVRISRLDTAVDFEVDETEFNFEFYKEVKPKYAKAVQITYGKSGKAETWNGVFSSKDGFVRMYDKTAQVKKKNLIDQPLSRLTRFEYRLERKSLSRAHIHSLSDINQNKFEYALRLGWEASKAGSLVNDPTSWIDKINGSTLKESEKANLLSYLWKRLRSSSDPEPLSQNIEVAQSAAKAGISMKQKLSKQWAKAMYLDLNSQQLKFI